jgi:hypothetical protein
MNEIWPHMSAVDRRFLEEPINTGSDLFQSLQIIFNTWAYVHQGGQPAPNAIMHLYNPMSRVPGHGKGICQACGVELEMGMPFESDKLLFERGKYAKCIDKPKTGE